MAFFLNQGIYLTLFLLKSVNSNKRLFISPIPNDHVPFRITQHKFVFVTPIYERGHTSKHLKFLKVSSVSCHRNFCPKKLS